MPTTSQDWHARFQQQAAWTGPVRQFLLSRLSLPSSARILEAGCGTGVIASTLNDYAHTVVGLDFNPSFLHIAGRQHPNADYVCANALQMPFPAGSFDAVVCHFFLLWIQNPARVLAEMLRAARVGSAVIAFAEPDYGGRIDYPPAFEELGELQTQALRRQGADPFMGRKLNEIFHQAGLRDIETGLLGGQWSGTPSQAQLNSEWATLEADLTGILPQARMQELHRQETAAWQAGRRVLFVPTFYAVGFKP